VANTSAINSSQSRDEWYFDTLEHSFFDTMTYAKEKYGYVPQFLQQTFLCDFKWRITQSRKDNKYIDTNPERYNEYFRLLTKCINEMDVEAVMNNRFYDDTLKLFVLKEMQKRKLTVKNTRGVNCYFYEDKWLFDMSRLCVAEPCMFEPGDGRVELYFTVDCPADVSNYSFFLEVDKTRVYASEIKTDEHYNLHLLSHVKKHFKVTIPLGNTDVYFSFGMSKNKKSRSSMLEINRFGKFFPLNTVDTSYFSFGNRVLKKSSKNVFVIKRSSALKKCLYELKYDKSLLKLKNPRGYKIVAYRWIYFIGKMFHKKPRWLLMDRINKADDNAEALFDYICKQRPEVKARFVIAEGEEHDRLLKEYKNVTVYNSRRHYIDYILSDRIISSHVDDFVMRPLSWKQVYIKDITANKKFIFLQHGVTQNDISAYLNKFSKNVFGITVVSKVERDLFRGGKFAYKNSNIWLDGFARFDRLYDASEKKITLMPTWRSYLAVGMNSETGVWTLVNDFKDSDFFNFYNDLLNDERLINAAAEHGYTLQFMPHPILAPHIDLFDKNERVVFLDGMNSYRDVYAESDLVLTDYSSAVFDFAYLRKPVVYAQFDREEMLRRATTYSLNCDFYDTYGFGEITPDYETTVNTLIEYIEGGCKLKDKYRDRIDSFFAFDDKGNCERIVNKILATD
jgi:CDP-glycerol glycerophosphotransferase (TagB/SpsB family)